MITMKLPTGVKSVLFFPSLESEFAGFNAENILESLLQGSTDCIAIKDRQGRYIWINPAGARFLERTVDEVIGKTDLALFTLEAARKIMESDQKVMLSGETETMEGFLKPIDGINRYFQAMKCPYRNSAGRVAGIINVVRDMTDQSITTKL